MNSYIACYIDDETTDAQDYIKRLNTPGELQVYYSAPTKDLNLDNLSPDTQLFFVDWELDTEQLTGETVAYKGGTFATRLRERYENLPIVLITRKGLLDERLRRRYIDSLLFDEYIFKSSIVIKPEIVVKQCIELITGFQILRNTDNTWSGLRSVLQANQEEEKILGEASPPLFKSDRTTAWSVPDIAKWIRKVLLKYPGILYDSLHAATFLGIDEDAFVTSDVQNIFQNAKYTGIFNPVEGRWWRGRLLTNAQEFITKAGFVSSSVNKDFATAFAKIHGKELNLAECVYSKKKPADWVCYVLEQPVLIEYSLVYHPDNNRPSIMDDARVSFKAIRTSNEVFDEYFDPSSQQLLEEIRSWEKDEF